MIRVPIGNAIIAVNAMFLDPGVSGGVETYVRALVPTMAQLAPAARFIVFTTGRGSTALRADPAFAGVEIVRLPAEEGQRLRRLRAEQLALPRAARRRGADLLWSTASVAPVRPGMRSAITLHDVTMFEHATFGRLTTTAMRLTMETPARHADVLISGSAAARDRACAVFGLDPSRFVVVPHGAGRPPADLVAVTPELKVRERYGLSGARVVLCVAAKRPHKNQELLVRAMTSLPEDVVLVLAGHPEPYDTDLRELARTSGVDRRVRFADYVPDADLEALFALADVAAFPTRAEGFGLPVVEAMARGVPVVAADIPVLREVGGDAVLYADPDDPGAAAAAIQQALAHYDKLAAAGHDRARCFTWEAAAQGTLDAFDRALRR